MTDTLRYIPDAPLDQTVITPPQRLENVSTSLAPLPLPVASAARRTTVLPRVEWTGDQPMMNPLTRERFEEVRPLGQGGMGEVLLLKDHDIERLVALKRLPETNDLDRVLRFVEEIRTVGQLDHPNIVPVHDVGIDHLGRYFFVMKHLQGETLESIIEKLRQGDAGAHARFTFANRVQVMLGVLNALDYAHRKGFIHRDLKPANIMVGPYGEVTVMDWGLARRVQQPDAVSRSATPSVPTNLRAAVSLQTQMGAVVGTPFYMSPEQARGQHDAVDARSDTYSLGILFHEFLYLRHYLEGRQTLAEVLEGVATAMPDIFTVESSPHQPSVPAEYAWFVRKGVEKDPARRYQSVAEMKEDLQAAQEGRFKMVCRRTMLKGGLHKLLRSVDQHPTAMFLGSGLALLAVLGALGHLLMTLLG